jgi:hypothetical protein
LIVAAWIQIDFRDEKEEEEQQQIVAICFQKHVGTMVVRYQTVFVDQIDSFLLLLDTSQMLKKKEMEDSFVQHDLQKVDFVVVVETDFDGDDVDDGIRRKELEVFL